MNALLVDLGNTRLKWARADAEHFAVGTPIAHGDADWTTSLADAWARLPPPVVLWSAAVARPAVFAQMADVARRIFPGTRIERVHTPRAALGLQTNYEDPAMLGVDRFLGVLAAWRRGIAPALVVGAGTAVTVDFLEAEGTHAGGWIAPSPRLMREAVLRETSAVAWAQDAKVVDYATTTRDALESGCWHAAAGLVQRAQGKFARRIGAEPRLLLTGGDAPALAALLSCPHELASDLVLEGLWQLARTGQVGSKAPAPGPGPALR